MFFFFFGEMSFKKENYRREPGGGGVQLFLLNGVLNKPFRKKKKRLIN